MAVVVRSEHEGDEAAIHRLTAEAFADKPYSGGQEANVIDRLRLRGRLSLSLVALEGERLVGQVSFSPVVLTSGTVPWFGLGPVAVLPGFQGRGFGDRLIRAGLKQISARSALGCVLVGNPAYYRRFGFEPAPENAPVNEPAEFFMLKVLGKLAPQGRFSFDAAFYG